MWARTFDRKEESLHKALQWFGIGYVGVGAICVLVVIGLIFLGLLWNTKRVQRREEAEGHQFVSRYSLDPS